MSPTPALTKERLAELVLAKGRRDVLTLIPLFSRTSLLRIPSGRLPLAMQRVGGELSSDYRLGRKGAIRLAGRKLLFRLKRRKHISAGARMRVSFFLRGNYAL